MLSPAVVAALAIVTPVVVVYHKVIGCSLSITFHLVKTALQYAARGFKPRYPEWTFQFELARAFLHYGFAFYGASMTVPATAQANRAFTARLGNFLGGIACRQFNTQVTPVVVNDLEHLWLTSKDTPTEGAKRFVVLYYHGGGYTIFCPRLYVGPVSEIRECIVKQLREAHNIENPRVDFFLANYRKSPEHKFPIPNNDCVAMLEYLVDVEGILPSQIIIMGDSAGGGIVLATMLLLKKNHPEYMPLAAVAMCPMADMTPPVEGEVPPDHCVLSYDFAEASRQALHNEPFNPATFGESSPAQCDLRGLAPTLVQIGEKDFIFNMTESLMAKAKEDGVTNMEFSIHKNMVHVFPLTPPELLPYAKVGVAEIATFAAKHFTKTIKKKEVIDLDEMPVASAS
ncbi:Carbohydrate esterase, partial [Globisporangium splendens]